MWLSDKPYPIGNKPLKTTKSHDLHTPCPLETPPRPNHMVRPYRTYPSVGRLFRATQHRTLAIGN